MRGTLTETTVQSAQCAETGCPKKRPQYKGAIVQKGHYTKRPLYKEAIVQRGQCTKTMRPLYKEANAQKTVVQRGHCTKRPLHRGHCTKRPLNKEANVQRGHCTKRPMYKKTCTKRALYKKASVQRDHSTKKTIVQLYVIKINITARCTSFYKQQGIVVKSPRREQSIIRYRYQSNHSTKWPLYLAMMRFNITAPHAIYISPRSDRCRLCKSNMTYIWQLCHVIWCRVMLCRVVSCHVAYITEHGCHGEWHIVTGIWRLITLNYLVLCQSKRRELMGIVGNVGTIAILSRKIGWVRWIGWIGWMGIWISEEWICIVMRWYKGAGQDQGMGWEGNGRGGWGWVYRRMKDGWGVCLCWDGKGGGGGGGNSLGTER